MGLGSVSSWLNLCILGNIVRFHPVNSSQVADSDNSVETRPTDAESLVVCCQTVSQQHCHTGFWLCCQLSLATIHELTLLAAEPSHFCPPSCFAIKLSFGGLCWYLPCNAPSIMRSRLLKHMIFASWCRESLNRETEPFGFSVYSASLHYWPTACDQHFCRLVL